MTKTVYLSRVIMKTFYLVLGLIEYTILRHCSTVVNYESFQLNQSELENLLS
jgi:hypothetical protein